jgi:hypothetical protein
MRNVIKILPICIMLLIRSESMANESALFSGAGAHTCGKFASDYLRNPEIVEGIYYDWAQGFMSAMNFHFVVDGVKGRKGYYDLDDMKQNKAKLRTYCNAHPLASYMDAVIDLLGSLPVKPVL